MNAVEARTLIEGQHPDLRVVLDEIDGFNREAWSQISLPWFTDHSTSHSDRVEAFLYDIVPEDLPERLKLTALEWFALIAAAKLHDLGMQDEAEPGKPRDQFTAADYDAIRSDHPVRSSELIRDAAGELGLDKDPELLAAVCLIARGHGTHHFADARDLLQASVPPRNEAGFRGALLAALLLYADELDLHNGRARFPGTRDAPLSDLATAHHFRHYYVSRVEVRHHNRELTVRLVLEFQSEVTDNARWAIERWLIAKLRSQMALIAPVISDGLEGHLNLSRAVEVASRTELTPVRTRTLPPAALAVIREAVAREDLPDLGPHVERLRVAIPENDLIGLGGRGDRGDPDGRDDLARWVATRLSLESQVVVSEPLRRGSLSDMLDDWLNELGIARSAGPGLRAHLGPLNAELERRAGPDQYLSFLALGVDLLPPNDVDRFTASVVPVLRSASSVKWLLYTSAKKLDVAGAGHAFEPLGPIVKAEIRRRYAAVTQEQHVIDALVDSSDSYERHRDVLARLEIALQREVEMP